MLYIGLAVGIVIGSFMTVIMMALYKEVSVEHASEVSTAQTVQRLTE